MWLNRKRIFRVLKFSGMKDSEVAATLEISECELKEILYGQKAANLKQAKKLLDLFGIYNICWAMKNNWKWMPYAIQSVLAN